MPGAQEWMVNSCNFCHGSGRVPSFPPVMKQVSYVDNEPEFVLNEMITQNIRENESSSMCISIFAAIMFLLIISHALS